MALATQCPHCHTTFRVAHDQLKLRAGLVRCGACKQIFNGIENLLRQEELEQAVSPAAPPVHLPPVIETVSEPEETPQNVEKPAPSVDFNPGDLEPAPAENTGSDESAASGSHDLSLPDEPGEQRETEPDATPTEPQKEDPLLRMTLMDFAHERHEPPVEASGRQAGDETEGRDENDPIEQAIDDLESKPWRREQDASELAEGDALDQAEAADYEEPSFVKQGRRKQRIGRAVRIFMAAGSVFLLLGLLAQSAYVFRDQIAAWLPASKPILAEACTYLGCQVGLPAQIEAVSIESSELQTLSANAKTFVLTILLRNHSATEQAWPNVELTLNDTNEKPIARRVFLPREYLKEPADAKKGFAARSEQAVKLHFELAQLKASGYRVYLFYP